MPALNTLSPAPVSTIVAMEASSFASVNARPMPDIVSEFNALRRSGRLRVSRRTAPRCSTSSDIDKLLSDVRTVAQDLPVGTVAIGCRLARQTQGALGDDVPLDL